MGKYELSKLTTFPLTVCETGEHDLLIALAITKARFKQTDEDSFVAIDFIKKIHALLATLDNPIAKNIACDLTVNWMGERVWNVELVVKYFKDIYDHLLL